MPVSRRVRLAALALSLLILVAGCAEDARRPASNPDLELRFAHTYPVGGATAPVSKRIYLSDVVVWARLVESTPDRLRFHAIEYLKGSGESEFVVILSPEYRRTNALRRIKAWDERDAILFLSLPAGQVANRSGARSEFTFTDTVPSDYGFDGSVGLATRPIGFRFEMRNPVWLPAVEPPAAADTQNSDPHFFIEKVSPAGIELPAISLSELRSMIEWQKPREDIAGYNDCVAASVRHEQWVRDYEGVNGMPLEVTDARNPSTEEIPSGASEGTILGEYVTDDDGYMRVWIEEGPHAHLFKAFIFDDDENPANGLIPGEATTRPLPMGTYTYKARNQPYRYQSCNFDPIGNGAYVQVVAIAPPGTWHEAFFDPVMLPDGSVGANSTQGVLDPAHLQSPLIAAEIVSLAWHDGAVTLIENEISSLEAYTLDFFEVDGSISLSLDAYTADPANAREGSYIWYVPDQPWHPGDTLMLRIRETRVGPTIVAEQNDLAAQLREHRNKLERRYAEYGIDTPAPDYPTETPVPSLENTQQEITRDDGDGELPQEEANESSGWWYALAIVFLLSVGVAATILSRR